MFAVVYRWKLKPGAERRFRDAWRSLTESIRRRYGTSGSRLHRNQEGELVAYAVWPNRERWSEAGALPSVDPVASKAMRECIEQSFPSMGLEAVEDLLS